ncbi:efflux transporter outer membrane subunit [Roseateles violae]|uniref:Efflux transporter outer membrane subunit n=1 Tax=Roseateles violae TaxID=3058042 RepID=A0ABT8DQZ7_9BURK|nr:efflux transporter outer membrane subunit [Pelomonas sp. PFR6]MDN3920602.1 efflux transporter outer membrane subunit [Pelomonas sp. PFR6]
MKNKQRIHAPAAVALAAAALLSACAPIPKLPEAPPALTAAKLGLKNPASPSLAGQQAQPDLRADWWFVFRDRQLNVLMGQALRESPSLATARARIARANASAEAAGAASKPVVGAGMDLTYQRFTEHGLYPPPIAGDQRATIDLRAVNVTYEWDFFGRHQAELAAAIGQEKAALADAAAARLMLSTQLTRSYLALARVLDQRQLLGEQLAERERALALVRERVAAGLDNEQELRGAEQPVPELRRQRLVLDEQAALLRHQLAALSVQPLEAIERLRPRLPDPLTLQGEQDGPGLDLLGRRPDVVAARWRAEAATQQVSATRALFYPNISLNGFVGLSSIGLDNLGKGGSLVWGLGPSLRLPLFDTGRLSAQLHGSAAELNGAVASYNATLLDAVRDARDQLVGVQSAARQQQEQQALLSNARSSADLARQRFEAGLGSRLALLNAHYGLLVQQRQALDLRAQTLDSQVGLMRALGGGWSESLPPAAQE